MKEPKVEGLDFSSAMRKGKVPGSHHPWKLSKCLISYTKTSWKTVNLRMTSNLDSSATSPQKCCNTSTASQLPLPQKNKVVFSSQPTRPGRAALVSLRPFRLFVPNRDGIPHNGAGEDNEVVPGEVALMAMQTFRRPRRVAFLSLQFPPLFWEKMETCSSIHPSVVSTTCFFFRI